ncbi:MAG: hypothetical protein ABJG88_00690 [Litorimonas sp.]
MLRMFWQHIFGKIQNVEEYKIADVNQNLEWSKLSEDFEDNFKLRGKKYVGRIYEEGFDLQLNKVNMLPFIPLVEVRKKGNQIFGRIEYGRLAKTTQIYWNSIFTYGVFMFLLGSFLQWVDPRKSNDPVIGGLITSFIILCILLFFLYHRKVLWSLSIEESKKCVYQILH